MLAVLTYDQSVISVQQHIFPIFAAIALHCLAHPYVRISLARFEVQVLHAVAKMVTEVSTSGLAAVQCSPNKGLASNILKSKLRAADDKILL